MISQRDNLQMITSLDQLTSVVHRTALRNLSGHQLDSVLVLFEAERAINTVKWTVVLDGLAWGVEFERSYEIN